MASVVGIPLAAYVGETWGWRWAFVGVALLSLAAAAAVWRALPDGIRPTALSLADWRSVFTHPVLMAIVAVTAMSSAGQFTLFSYFAPYYRQVLGASAAEISLLFLWFGALGLVGNVLLTRLIDRIGAATAVALTLACMAVSLLAWPLAVGFTSALTRHCAVGAGLFRVQLGAAGAAGAGRTGPGHGADLVELVGHVPGTICRLGQRRRDDQRRRLRWPELDGAGLDVRGAGHQPVGGAAACAGAVHV